MKKIYLNSVGNVDCDDVALGIQYLENLEELCKKNEIVLHVLHAPVSEEFKEEILEERKKAFSYNSSDEVKDLLQGFYDSISFYPADEFRDGIHFTKERRR